MIIFDFEVYKLDWVMCALDTSNGSEKAIVNNSIMLKEFYKLHEEDLWVGYNSKNYDRYILDAILNDKDPKIVNDDIILHKKKLMEPKVPKKHYDSFIKLMDTDYRGVGLKTLEGMMGLAIVETNIPFDINRRLTDEELQKVVDYCLNDVRATASVVRYNAGHIKTTLSLVQEFNLPMSYLSKTHAQITATVLKAVPIKLDMLWPDKLSISPKIIFNEKYEPILNFFKCPENIRMKNSKAFEVAGIPHSFGWGGLHGALNKYHKRADSDTKIGYVDVTQYYPSIMLQHGYLSRAINRDLFKWLYDERLRHKALAEEFYKNGDKQQGVAQEQMADTLKVVINSVFGISRDEFNPAYDPYNFNNVVVNGQLMITDLISLLEDVNLSFKLIQTNTDGIIFEYKNDKMVRGLCAGWASRLGFTFKFKNVEEIWQKDVNNYLIKFTDGKTSGKGSLFKDITPLDNELAVITNACTSFLLDQIPYQDTINNCNNLIDFQQIIKIPKNFDRAVILNEGGCKILNTKVQRIFYGGVSGGDKLYGVNDENKMMDLFGNISYRKFGKIARADPPLTVINSDIQGIGVQKWLDKKRYIKIVEDTLPDYGVQL